MKRLISILAIIAALAASAAGAVGDINDPNHCPTQYLTEGYHVAIWHADIADGAAYDDLVVVMDFNGLPVGNIIDMGPFTPGYENPLVTSWRWKWQGYVPAGIWQISVLTTDNKNRSYWTEQAWVVSSPSTTSPLTTHCPSIERIE